MAAPPAVDRPPLPPRPRSDTHTQMKDATVDAARTNHRPPLPPRPSSQDARQNSSSSLPAYVEEKPPLPPRRGFEGRGTLERDANNQHSGEKAFQHDASRPLLIRLFKLDLNEDGEPLTGKLLSTTNSSNPLDGLGGLKEYWHEDSESIMPQLGDGKDMNYDAFSYTWGSPQPPPQDEKRDKKAVAPKIDTYPLFVSTIANKLSKNGEVLMDHKPERNGVLQITSNLNAFLCEMRRQRYNRFIWIDAICVDQNNPDDVQEQIPRMRDVYEYAERVLVWLGDASSVKKGALRIIPAINARLQIAKEDSARLDPTDPKTFDDAGLPEPSHEVWQAVSVLLARPYWSRLWTLQEVVMARALPGYEQDFDSYTPPHAFVLCGDAKVEWATFDTFASAVAGVGLSDWIVTGKWDVIPEQLHALTAISEVRTCRSSYYTHGWAVSLSALLVSTRRREASLSADMVVGMLAMLDRKTVRDLALDISLPVDEVFVIFGKHYVRNGVKECLLNHTATREGLPGLPSWCPNFASPEETVSLGSRWL